MRLLAAALLIVVPAFIVLSVWRCDAMGVAKVTNVNCTSLDNQFIKFRRCDLKAIGRGIIALNVDAELLQPVDENSTINLALYKRASGYRPFLYNYTYDFCKFLANPKRQPFINIVYNNMKNWTNLNHSCPYNHNIIIKDFVLKDEHFRFIPLPTGDYLVSLRAAVYDRVRATMKAYLTWSEEFFRN